MNKPFTVHPFWGYCSKMFMYKLVNFMLVATLEIMCAGCSIMFRKNIGDNVVFALFMCSMSEVTMGQV